MIFHLVAHSLHDSITMILMEMKIRLNERTDFIGFLFVHAMVATIVVAAAAGRQSMRQAVLSHCTHIQTKNENFQQSYAVRDWAIIASNDAFSRMLQTVETSYGFLIYN